MNVSQDRDDDDREKSEKDLSREFGEVVKPVPTEYLVKEIMRRSTALVFAAYSVESPTAYIPLHVVAGRSSETDDLAEFLNHVVARHAKHRAD